MSENRGTNVTNWLQKGALDNAQQQLNKTQDALDRGSIENAQTHLSKALDGLGQVTNLVESEDFVYPNLTDHENKLYRGLLRMKSYSGFSREKLSQKVKNEIGRLEKKAWGE